MIKADETFNGTFPFKANYEQILGFKMHYVDEGSGETVLCLHGQPTWGYLYRLIIPLLSNNYRVIAPDNMGFGKSETPQNKKYRLQEHIDNLIEFVERLDLKNITLVVHDWGGPIGAGLLKHRPDLVRRIVVMNSLLPFGTERENEILAEGIGASPWFEMMGGLFNKGIYDPVVINLFKYSSLSLITTHLGFKKTSNITEDWMRAYSEPFKTEEETLAAVAFPKSIIDGSNDLWQPFNEDEIKVARSKPTIMIEGLRDKGLPPEIYMAIFKEAFPDSEMYELPNAGHFLQEDEPQAIASLITQFIRTN